MGLKTPTNIYIEEYITSKIVWITQKNPIRFMGLEIPRYLRKDL